MKIEASFGFVTGCHNGDRHLVQATLASMRYYCPDVPICLVVDGHFDVSDLQRDYNLLILRPRELSNPEMRDILSGSFHAKLAAMFVGPFEHYVWIDSDAIVWGDFTSQIRRDLDFQIFWNEISIPFDEKDIPDWLPQFYLNPKILSQVDPLFDWRWQPYFCAGVYAARRNVISFDEYKQTVLWDNNYPGMFAWGDMGMLNYMILSKMQRGIIKVEMSDLQRIPVCHGTEEMIADCQGNGWNLPKRINRPRVLHFCGGKPWLFDRKSYYRPFTIARLEHFRNSNRVLTAWGYILWEDLQILKLKILNKIKKFLIKK